MADRVLVTELYPYIERAFSNKKNVVALETIIGKYIDRNSDVLSAIGPLKNISFLDRDRDPIYNIIGIGAREVKAIQNKSKDIKKNGAIMSQQFNSVLCMIVRYFTIMKNENMVHMTMLYMALSMYPSLFFKYFKYAPNENVMNYTINNLSNKFKLKQTSNLLTAIDETGFGGYSLHKDALVKGDDNASVQMVLAVKTRLNSFMKKISREFYKNHQEGKYLNTELDVNDEDNFREADSSMYAITRIVDKVALRLIIDGPPVKIINMAAKVNGVSVNELRNYVNTMLVDDNISDIKNILEAILVLYLFDEKNTIEEINSDKFMVYCLDVYRRSNTNNANVNKIKVILDSWLERLGTYKKTQRLATINDFRRALYTFFVMSIMYFNNQ